MPFTLYFYFVLLFCYFSIVKKLSKQKYDQACKYLKIVRKLVKDFQVKEFGAGAVTLKMYLKACNNQMITFSFQIPKFMSVKRKRPLPSRNCSRQTSFLDKRPCDTLSALVNRTQVKPFFLTSSYLLKGAPKGQRTHLKTVLFDSHE